MRPLAYGVEGYVLEPLVSGDARLGVMPAGTPIVERVPLELEPSGAIKGSGRRTSEFFGVIRPQQR
jgi:hypothetical protein